MLPLRSKEWREMTTISSRCQRMFPEEKVISSELYQPTQTRFTCVTCVLTAAPL